MDDRCARRHRRDRGHGATWAETAAERDIQLSLVAEKRGELATDLDDQVAELAAHYVGKGLRPELAREVAEQLTAHDALAAQLDAEHGIDAVMSRAAPVWSGLTAALAFAAGAAVPLAITLAVPVNLEPWAVFVAVGVSLALISLAATYLGGLSVSRTLVRTLAVGLGTLTVSYLVGLLLF